MILVGLKRNWVRVEEYEEMHDRALKEIKELTDRHWREARANQELKQQLRDARAQIIELEAIIAGYLSAVQRSGGNGKAAPESVATGGAAAPESVAKDGGAE